eukprot:CAMPEP_0180464678 /NCGR_PEP_ID=MMETSP1036_2-20121128/25567_1 /TAXON_ID=632150 /ORGANISM="Azadinium spinosum, Strain 3D9" /LENGTH=156 /DNA_ID=CAMNT_0022471535 /DNA_START=70 /DNA_END=540 /DNA_ORIENTATION=+
MPTKAHASWARSRAVEAPQQRLAMHADNDTVDHKLREREEASPHGHVPADEELAPHKPALPLRKVTQDLVPEKAHIAASTPDAVGPKEEKGRRPGACGQIDPWVLLVLTPVAFFPAATNPRGHIGVPSCRGGRVHSAATSEIADERQHRLHFLGQL